ncbi:MAG: adenylate/guanylate cyclase domain-containing protein [Acidimicrobiales bacterium]
MSGAGESGDSQRQMPLGRVTFLFTDIEGSTELWQRDSGAMSTALANHDIQVRGTIEDHGGYIFGVGGDGFFGAFGSALDAVEAARSIQHTMADDELINVRIGLNTGEAERRNGAFFGVEVNRTARIATCSHGGQTVLSDETAVLCSEQDVVDLGSFTLRGIDEPVSLWQLGSGDFPSLRSERMSGNLTVPQDSFVGREMELAELTALVLSKEVVTLVGMGGVGKTRLASHAGAELADQFRDGVFMATLASVDDPEVVASAVADAIGLRVSPEIAVVDAIKRWFDRHEVLLVLDNCEHMLDAAGDLIEQLLGTGSTSRILATSIVAIGIVGEHVVPVSPLSGSHGASSQLFLQRALAVRPDLNPTDGELATITEICTRLDHLPLAIELAASRMRAMTPAEISARLDEPLRLLAARNRRAPDRHKTLEATVRWSYELLDDQSRKVLRQLAIFVGPFGVQLAVQVLADRGLDEWDLLDAIGELVDRSLVASSVEDGATRYRLLEVIKAFGLEELRAHNELGVTTVAYTDEIHRRVVTAGQALLGSEDRFAVAALTADWPHVRAVLKLAADDDESTRFEEMYAALGTLWNEHGRTTEGVRWARVLLDRRVLDPHLRVAALNSASGAMNVQQAGAAKPFNEEAIALWRVHDTEPPLCALANQALDAMLNGRDDEGRALCRQVIDLAAENDTPSWNHQHAVPVAISILGVLEPDSEQFKAVWDNEMERATRIGCSWHKTTVRATMSRNVDKFPELGDPQTFVRQSVDGLVALGNPHSACHHLSSLAILCIRAGDTRSGVGHQLEALDLTLEHAPGYVAQRCVVVAALLAGTHPRDAAGLLAFMRTARSKRGNTGSTVERQVEDFAEQAIRDALGDDFDSAYAQGFEFDETKAVEIARSSLLEVAAAAESGGEPAPTSSSKPGD